MQNVVKQLILLNFSHGIKTEKQQQLAANPQPPQPTPEQMQLQVEQAKMQSELQLEQMRMQLEQQKAQLDQEKAQAELAMQNQKLEFEKWKTQLENDTKVLIAEMQAKKDIKTTAMSINAKDAETLTEVGEDGEEQPTSALSSLIEAINQNMASLVAMQAQHNQDLMMQQQVAHDNLVQQITRPKAVLRGADGKIIGVQ